MLRLVGERILELVFPHIRSRKAVLFALRTQGSASLYPGHNPTPLRGFTEPRSGGRIIA